MIDNNDLSRFREKRILWGGNIIISAILCCVTVVMLPIIAKNELPILYSICVGCIIICACIFIFSLPRWRHWSKCVQANIGIREWMR